MPESAIAIFKQFFEKYPEILTYQDKNGENLGMWAADLGLEEIVILTLNNEEASTQRNAFNDYNTGMIAARSGLEKATLKALDNEEANTQQAENGDTIGISAARSGLKNATQKAFLYPVGRYHKNKYGNSIESLALQNNIRVSQDGLEWEAFANDVVDSL